jgi:hypothetical protein
MNETYTTGNPEGRAETSCITHRIPLASPPFKPLTFLSWWPAAEPDVFLKSHIFTCFGTLKTWKKRFHNSWRSCGVCCYQRQQNEAVDQWKFMWVSFSAWKTFGSGVARAASSCVPSRTQVSVVVTHIGKYSGNGILGNVVQCSQIDTLQTHLSHGQMKHDNPLPQKNTTCIIYLWVKLILYLAESSIPFDIF